PRRRPARSRLPPGLLPSHRLPRRALGDHQRSSGTGRTRPRRPPAPDHRYRRRTGDGAMSTLPLILTSGRHGPLQAETPSPPLTGPVAPFLRDPAAVVHSFFHKTGILLGSYGWVYGLGAVCTTAIYVMLRQVWWRRYHARLADGARQITVLGPPEVDPHAA